MAKKKVATPVKKVRRKKKVAAKANPVGSKVKKVADNAPEPTPIQQQFEGDGFPEPPPPAVCRARDRYLQAMREQAKAGAEKSTAHEALIRVMHDHNIDRVPLDGENKYFEIDPTEKIKTKTVPKAKRDKRKKEEGK